MSSNPSSPVYSSPASTGFAAPYLPTFTGRYFRLSQAAFVISDYLVRKFRLAESVLLTSLCYWHEFVAAHGLRRVHEVLLATTCVFLAAKVEHAHIRLVHLVEKAFDLDTSAAAEAEQWCRGVLDVELLLCDTIRFDFVRIFPLADTLRTVQALEGADQPVPDTTRQEIGTAVRRVFLFSFVTPLCMKVSMRRLCTTILYMIVNAAHKELVPALQSTWGAPEAELPEEAELEGITGALMDVFAYLHKKFGVAALDDVNEARYKRRRSQHGADTGVPSSVFSSASADFTPLVKMAEQ